MDKIIIFIVSAVVLAGVGFGVWQSGMFKETPSPEGIILFYGEGCPHCKIVDDFIKDNKIEEKVKFSRLEVWYNKANQKIIANTAEKCGIPGDTVGVPFLYDGKNCLIGSPDIINFFKNEAGIK